MDANAASPNKRRALGALNANALPSPRHAKHHLDARPSLSPVKDADHLGRKRAREAVPVASPVKKACREDDVPSRSESPCSSVFDVSGNECSWANTTATEPDTSPAPRAMTREQAREKAEILRLRLGLASYKFRTGQTTIPLADLQRRPIPARVTRQEEAKQDKEKTGEEETEQGGDGVEERAESQKATEAPVEERSQSPADAGHETRVPEERQLVDKAGAATELLGLGPSP